MSRVFSEIQQATNSGTVLNLMPGHGDYEELPVVNCPYYFPALLISSKTFQP